MMYFSHGDLRKQLQNRTIPWGEKVQMIYYIAINMKEIHQAGLIHR